MRRHATLLLALAGGAPCLGFENMNGEYLTTPTPGCARGAPSCARGNYSTKWSEYRSALGSLEYFEVHLGPMQTLYSQVWWQTLPSLPLPPDLVKRFDGKAMARPAPNPCLSRTGLCGAAHSFSTGDGKRNGG